MRSDDHGTVTGRFACLDPNLQQIPAKKEKHGDLIRDILIPEDDCWYGAPDYSQIEYRILMHFASGPGAEEVRQKFINDPRTDYHQIVVDMTGLDRKHAKNFNFGSIYCMGKDTMRKKFGFSVEQCETLTEQYYGMMPFIKPTRNAIINTAKKRGYLRTVFGRRARVSQDIKASGGEYKLVNYLIQGSAADVMKKGMYDAYNAGVFNVLMPHITVHDELGVSVPKTTEGVEAYQELVHLMETCIKIDVPLHVDCDLGSSFGNLTENVNLQGTLDNVKNGIYDIATFEK
jgi:DNA polymerase-1